MKQRPKPCQQLLQLGVWTSPAWRFCCVSSAGVGGGGIGTPSRNPVGFLSWGCRQRSRKPCLFLFSPNWRPDVVSKWKIKLACWVSYSQTICPGHKGRPPQGWPEENRCSWGQGLLLFFQSLVCKVPLYLPESLHTLPASPEGPGDIAHTIGAYQALGDCTCETPKGE